MRNCLASLSALLVVFLLPFTASSQNLVPNPGFDNVNTCPNGSGCILYDPSYTTFQFVPGWISPVASLTPDAFHSCAPPNSGVHTPESDFGYQKPRSGGGYAGLIMWQAEKLGSGWTNDQREYLQCKLQQPLTAGQRYCVTFYVSNAISSIAALNQFNFVALDAVGLNLSSTRPSTLSGSVMPLASHVAATPGNFYTDSAGWTKVQSVYTAAGGEQWLTVGCFNQSAAPNYQLLFPSTPNPAFRYRSYLYFDDFSVVAITPGDTIKRSFDSLSCKKDSVNMVLTAPDDEGVYWNNGSTGQTLTATKPGTYWVRAQHNCQVYVDTFHVKYDPAKTLYLGRDTGNCIDQPFVIRTNPGFTSHAWSTGQTGDSITVSKSGVYYVSAQNECGLQHDTIKVFIQPPTAPPVVSDTTVCQFSPSPTLNVNGPNINWYTYISGLFGFPYQPEITTSQPTTFTFYVTSTIDYCESEKVPMNITVRYTPHKSLPEVAEMCARFPDSIGTYYPDVTYKWSTGEMACCIVPQYDGEYRLATINECGTYFDTTFVEFSACDTCIVVPNAFMPHGDYSTRLFKAIVTCPIQDFDMKIFNRWGQMVFTTQDVTKGWNGYYKNIPCDQGTFIYLIQYHSLASGKPQILKGNVTLLR
ncbi:gliding motility-associated C-terminal domain-containing protein [Polluticoccus soli]|uniref:T9SS type B sorting domain-containing protein n=1 Tax=Polluticoccus soli TaxID=3034150 RepID=UPI0023E2B692|nr:gliding motility-associated C-terminal domain-containing protein [Flavipsychrobacter sp. JY13-12]